MQPAARTGSARLIPAGAGSTAESAGDLERDAAHPRWRGEHRVDWSVCSQVCGSSPLARGAPPTEEEWHNLQRLIPAGAGSTQQRRTTKPRRQAHPRWRGEHTCGLLQPETELGSSPLARGARDWIVVGARRLRLIPAGAGSTAATDFGGRMSAAHPRWRGEHATIVAPRSRDAGSSPLARGAPWVRTARNARIRLIPAGAGSTHPQ